MLKLRSEIRGIDIKAVLFRFDQRQNRKCVVMAGEALVLAAGTRGPLFQPRDYASDGGTHLFRGDIISVQATADKHRQYPACESHCVEGL